MAHWLEKLKQALGGKNTQARAELSQHVDQLLERVDPRLKLVPDYQHQLRPVVAQLLQHIEGFYPALPEPVSLSLSSYASSPELKLIIPSPEALRDALLNARPLADWCAAQHSATDCYCLLAAPFEEYKRLGTALEHEVLVRDVLQQALRFSAPRLLCLSAELELLEDKIRQRAIDGYCNQAIQRKSTSAARALQLKSEEKLLKAQLKLRAQGHTGFANELTGDQSATMSRAELQQALEAIQQQLLALGAGQGQSIEALLSVVAESLSEPQAILDFRPQSYHVTLNGVLVSENDPAGEKVSWRTLVVNQQQQYAVIPVKLSATDLASLGLFSPLQQATSGRL